MNERELKLDLAKAMIEKYFVEINWNAEVILDPYTNKPYITSVINRAFKTIFLDKEEYSHPDGFWEFFKEKYFPNWLKRKFPVKMKTISFSARSVFDQETNQWKGQASMIITSK